MKELIGGKIKRVEGMKDFCDYGGYYQHYDNETEVYCIEVEKDGIIYILTGGASRNGSVLDTYIEVEKDE